MNQNQHNELMDTMTELISVIKSSEMSRHCKANPYKIVFTLDWKSITALAIGIIAIIDKLIDKLLN